LHSQNQWELKGKDAILFANYTASNKKRPSIIRPFFDK